MLVRPNIGRFAGQVVEMLPHDARRLEKAGQCKILSADEAAEYLALAQLEDVEEEVRAAAPPTPMAQQSLSTTLKNWQRGKRRRG